MSDQVSSSVGNSKQRNFRFPDHYKISDFLYGLAGPWPKPSIDHPVGQAPEILNIPQPEWDDWQKNVGDYYISNALTYSKEAFEYSVKMLTYPDLDDARFTELIAHGLYSKFLCPLDAPDEVLFQNFMRDTAREYLKNDLSHMRVVLNTFESDFGTEYVAPAIVLLSRPKTRTPENDFDYQVDAIALSHQAKPGDPYSMGKDMPVFKPGDGDAWKLAKYFALQGAIHRINLIDHTIVHFPSDAINAITKTVLPKSNLLLQLLLPHFWLTLPVNNTVLEGDRSLINRDTWYPWSPFTAQGDEIRKLLPFAWYGSDYYLAEDDFWKDRVQAYPAYNFSLKPRDIPSKYGKFLNAYYEPILSFTRKVVQCIPQESTHADWVEIRRETLASTLAAIIWNAAIAHTADHITLHAMFEGQQPIPYIMRVEPPKSLPYNQGAEFLCWPNDIFSGRLADLLFYLPHNSSLLIDCNYDFNPNHPDLKNAISEFQKDLRATAKLLKAEGIDFGIKLESDKTGKEKKVEEMTLCIGAGIQY